MDLTPARGLRAAHHMARVAASEARKASLRLRYPNLRFVGSVHIAANCDIQVGRGATLTIEDCHIAQGVTLVAGADAVLHVGADFIGPYSTVVAREHVTIGSGSKLAERTTVRDGNHDHSVPLRSMKFTSSPVEIGSDVWVCAGAVILEGITVGDGSTVAAGAVVTKDVRAGATVVGVPAREVGLSRV